MQGAGEPHPHSDRRLCPSPSLLEQVPTAPSVSPENHSIASWGAVSRGEEREQGDPGVLPPFSFRDCKLGAVLRAAGGLSGDEALRPPSHRHNSLPARCLALVPGLQHRAGSSGASRAQADVMGTLAVSPAPLCRNPIRMGGRLSLPRI